MPSYNVNGLMLDAAHSLNRDLVLWWPTLEKNGTRVGDISLRGNQGTFGNIVQGSTSGWSGGSLGGSVQFDGVDDKVSAKHNLSLTFGVNTGGAASFSMSVWIRSATTGFYPCPVSKGYVIVAGAGKIGPFALGTTPGQQFEWVTGDRSIGNNPSAVVSYQLNRWHHVVGTYSSLTQSIYLDGSLADAKACTINPLDNGDDFQLGTNADNSRPMACFLSNVRLWRRALSANEIRQLYVNPWAGAFTRSLASLSTYIPLPSTIVPPESSDRLWNHGHVKRIFRRGEQASS